MEVAPTWIWLYKPSKGRISVKAGAYGIEERKRRRRDEISIRRMYILEDATREDNLLLYNYRMAWYIYIIAALTVLDEADLLGIFLEATAADVEPVLADDAGTRGAHAALARALSIALGM